MTTTSPDQIAAFLALCLDQEADRVTHDVGCDRFEVYSYGTRQGTCDCQAQARLRADVEFRRALISRLSLHAAAGDAGCARMSREVLTAMAKLYGEDPEYRWIEGNPLAGQESRP